MLFLAVFLGFIAENLREHYVEHQRVKQYARSLIYDLKEDTAMINLIMEQIQEARSNIDSFAAYITDRNMQDIQNIDLFMMTEKSDLYRPYAWSRATIEQIKNSGSLRYFSNDSIVNRISAYDALSRHLDEDFRGDEEREANAKAKRNQVVDMNYPDQFVSALENNRDSMMNTDWFKEIALNGPALLTGNLNDIKILLNEKILIRNALAPRIGRELPLAKNYAKELILLLKKEYHFE